MSSKSRRLDSVCVYCASSNAADPDFLAAASQLGAIIAGEGLRLVYGGGGVGLMGATARAAFEAGGRVLGVIPHFLTSHERPLKEVPTIIVQSMHERKLMMFEEADAFAILPGGIGTLEEVIEPYLLQQGLIQRTPRGRMLSASGFRHIGLNPPQEVLVQLDLLARGEEDGE